jgi:hypothetical protein
MNNVLDTAGVSATAQSVEIPPAQSAEISPNTKSETNVVGGPTIKINVKYNSSLHEIHLPAESTFGEFHFLLFSIHEFFFHW